MYTHNNLFIRVCLTACFVIVTALAQQLDEIHVGSHHGVGFKAEHIEHFYYEKQPDKKLLLVTRLTKNGINYELLNYETSRNYTVVKINGETRERLLDFKVPDGPYHWLVDIEVTDKQIVIATITPEMAYSVFRFVKKDGAFEREMGAFISFPIGIRKKDDEPKLKGLSLDKSYNLIASFDKGGPIVYSFPDKETEVHVNGKKPERSAGTIYWPENK